MALTLITAPAPIMELSFLREHTSVDASVSDSYLSALLAAATSMVDAGSWVGRALGVQTWELTYDTFPTGAIQIPYPPLRSVESVKYVNPSTGSLDTVDPADYYVDTDSIPGWVVPASSWPTAMNTANAIRIRFVAGHDEVPELAKVAVATLVVSLYDGRGATGDDLLARGTTAHSLISKLWLPSI